MFGTLEASVLAMGAGTGSEVAVGGLATEGELTSSAQDVPEAGWKAEAVTFIPGVAVATLASGLVMRSASEPPEGVLGEAMLKMQVAEFEGSAWEVVPPF